jgi:hypothetical protein
MDELIKMDENLFLKVFPVPKCCGYDTFGARLFSRMRLDHVVAQNVPAFMFIKAAITTASVYLFWHRLRI